MNTWVKVARYHLVRPANYLALPLLIVFTFAVAAGTLGRSRGHGVSGFLVSLAIYFAILGMQAIGRSLPFGLTLGASRRSFCSGTALAGMALALVSGLVLTVLQAVERATGGWGLSMRYFRVPYLLNGPWYDTWLTSAVGLSALFVYGMWYGIVYHRWGTLGTLAFIAAQALVVTAGVVSGAFENGYAGSAAVGSAAVGSAAVRSAAGGSFAGLSALGLTGVIAALAVLILAGGQATIRRATV
jgi:hypothetical protein